MGLSALAWPRHDHLVMGLGKWAAVLRGQCMGAPHGCVLVVAKVMVGNWR